MFTAMSLKQDVLAQANVLLADATKADADRLKNVVKALSDSLDSSLWVGDFPQAIDQYKNAWQKARDAVK